MEPTVSNGEECDPSVIVDCNRFEDSGVGYGRPSWVAMRGDVFPQQAGLAQCDNAAFSPRHAALDIPQAHGAVLQWCHGIGFRCFIDGWRLI